MCLGKRDDVGRVHRVVLFRRSNPDFAEGAAVVVLGQESPSKPPIPDKTCDGHLFNLIRAEALVGQKVLGVFCREPVNP